MIYSPDHKFLMVKNLKVGGTSLEVELSKVLPHNAIVTPINPANPNHLPRNFTGFYNHMPYKEINSKLDLNKVKSYVFVRHPYDIILSYFFHYLNSSTFKWKNMNDFEKEDLLEIFFFNPNEEFEMLKSTKDLYTVKKDRRIILVDEVLRYENGIEKEINKVLKKHRIPEIKMNTFEKQYKPKELSPYNVFKDKHLQKIYYEWIWEFNEFGYKP
jgi:hypothetical protein